MFFLTSEDFYEVRIFKSRLQRITERGIECPVYFQREISDIVRETTYVRLRQKEIYKVERSIVPIVRYLTNYNIDVENDVFSKGLYFDIDHLKKLIEVLGRNES